MVLPYFGTFAQGEYLCEMQNDELRLWLKQSDNLYEMRTNFGGLPEEIRRASENLQDFYEYLCSQSGHFILRDERFFVVILTGLMRRRREIEMKINRLEAPSFEFLQANIQTLQQRLEQTLSQKQKIALQNERLVSRVQELEETLQSRERNLIENMDFLREKRSTQNLVEQLQKELKKLAAIHKITVQQNSQLRKNLRNYQQKIQILSYRQSHETSYMEKEKENVTQSLETENTETELNQTELAEGPQSRILQDYEEEIATVQQINQRIANQLNNEGPALQRSNRFNRNNEHNAAEQRLHSEPHSVIMFQQKRKEVGDNILSLVLQKYSQDIQKIYKQTRRIGPFLNQQKNTIFSQPIFTNLDAPIIKMAVIQAKLGRLFVGLSSSNSSSDGDKIMMTMSGKILVGSRATDHSYKQKKEFKNIETIELKANFKQWQCSFNLNNLLIETVSIPQNLRKKAIYFFTTLYQDTIISI